MENKGFTVEHIDRKNAEVDELAKAPSQKIALPLGDFFQTIEDAYVKTIESTMSCTGPIIAYLRHDYEIDSNIDLIRMQQRAKAYQIINNELSNTSITGPLLHCLSKAEGKEMLSEISCGGHIGARALAAKVLRQGFY
jgi:hypothetical protein